MRRTAMWRSTVVTFVKSARPRPARTTRVPTPHAVRGVLLQYRAHLPTVEFRLIQIRQNHLRSI